MKTTHSAVDENIEVLEENQNLSSRIQSALFNQLLIQGRKFAPGPTYSLIRKTMFKPRPLRISEKAKEWLNNSTPSDLFVKGINRNVKIWTWGEGKPILLIHGWAGRGIQLHNFIAPLLAKGFQVITLDFPGHGDSEGNGASFLEWCHTAYELMERYPQLEGIIAHSMGCAVAQVMASRYKSSEFKLTLMAPHYHLREEFDSWLKARKLNPSVMDNFILLGETVFDLHFDDHDPFFNAPKITFPTLLIHDRDDRAASHNNSVKLNEVIEKSQLISTDKLGHNKILREPEVVSQVVDFMAR